ncbi:hypothetical protein QTP88_011748 [Uroleucon formosanum]
MPSSCCVVFCTSGYKSNPEKVSLFQFSKNEILREKLEKSIPSANLVINSKTVICEKHFTPDQIVRTWESGSSASKVTIHLKRANLTHDVVSSIFSGPKYLSNPMKERKLPSKRVLYSSINEAIVLLEKSNCIVDGMVCDGASTNRKLWTEFVVSGIKGNVKNYFTHPSNENRKV